MSSAKNDQVIKKVSFEDALNQTGFGAYSYVLTALTGISVISYVSILYSNTLIVPASACELDTTTAQQGLLIAVPSVGTIIGALFWGYLADTRGRKSMLMASFLTGAAFNALASLSVNWIMLMVLQFAASFLASGQNNISMTILSESVPAAKRNFIMLLVTSIFMLSQGVMAVLAIPIIPLGFSYYLPALGIYWNSWRTLLLVYCAPSLLCALWLVFMQDSPKYIFAKGNEEEALKILRVIHRINKGRSNEEYEVKGLLEEKTDKKTPAGAKSSARDQIIPLFRPPLLKYTIIMSALSIFMQVRSFMMWMPTLVNQVVEVLSTGEGFELTLCDIIAASQDVPPDPDATPCALNEITLLIMLGVALLQSFINGILSLVINRVGLRNMVMVITSVCGVSGIILNLIPNAIASAVLFVIFIMGALSFGLYMAITVGLYPTHLRALALSVTMTGGRVANFGVVQLLNYLFVSNCELGFYIFATIFTSSALVAIFLPDDLKLAKKPSLPDDIKQNDEEEKDTQNSKL